MNQEIGPVQNNTDILAGRSERFLRNIKEDRPPAIILGGGSTNGLAFFRSLGRKGIPVIAVDAINKSAMRSRYCLSVEHTWDKDGESALLTLLDRIGQRLPTKGVVIPTSDAYVLFASKHRQELRKYFELVLTEESTLEKLANKKFRYQYAKSVGVPIPETYYLDLPGSVEEAAKQISYPCILKPVYSYLWQQYRRETGAYGLGKVIICNSPQELFEMCSWVTGTGVEWVVQERIEGGDDQLYALYAYFDRSSQPLALFVRRKLRQWPVDFGVGSYSIGVRQDEIVASGVRLLQGLGYQGPTNIEFKKDPKDRQFKLIEVNLRSALMAGLAVDSGVDLPFIAYEDALGRSVEPVNSYKVGVRWINLASDISSFREYRRRKQIGLWSWLRSVKDARSYAYFAWDDPAPFLLDKFRLAKAMAVGMISKLLHPLNPHKNDRVIDRNKSVQ